MDAFSFQGGIMSVLLRLSMALFLLGCSQYSNTPTAPYSDINQQAFTNNKNDPNYNIQVVDEFGQPVPNARIMVGKAQNTPFANNVSITDSNGNTKVSPNWQTPAHITIDAGTTVRTTFLNLSPSHRVFVVKRKKAHNAQATGVTNSYGKLKKDGWVNFSLILGLMNRSDMLQFDLTKIISPINDKLKIAGFSFEIPSNLSLPTQKERYALFTLKINKPQFTLPLAHNSSQEIMATHGKFPFRKVASDLRKGKSIFDVINEFQFIGGGIKKYSPTGGNITIPVNQINFNSKMQVKAPALPAGYNMVGISLSEKANTYYPTDVKKVQTNQIQILKSVAGKKQLLLGVLAKEIKKGKKLSLAPGISISLTLPGGITLPSFLDVPGIPIIHGRKITFNKPQSVTGIIETGTYINLHIAQTPITTFSSQVKVTTLNKKLHWEIYGADWISNLELPILPGDNPNIQKNTRLEVIYLGSEQVLHSKGNVGPDILEVSTHAARNATTF